MRVSFILIAVLVLLCVSVVVSRQPDEGGVDRNVPPHLRHQRRGADRVATEPTVPPSAFSPDGNADVADTEENRFGGRGGPQVGRRAPSVFPQRHRPVTEADTMNAETDEEETTPKQSMPIPPGQGRRDPKRFGTAGDRVPPMSMRPDRTQSPDGSDFPERPLRPDRPQRSQRPEHMVRPERLQRGSRPLPPRPPMPEDLSQQRYDRQDEQTQSDSDNKSQL